jgi:DNA polymerase
VSNYYSLPAKLDKLAHVLGFRGKDPAGARLITKYSKLHLKTAKPVIPPEDFDRFVAYCKWDVEIERTISNFLGGLPARELPIFELDLKINARGLYLDRAGIAAATEIMDQRASELTEEFKALVGFAPTQVAKVQAWLQEQGVKLENMQADYLEELIEEGDLPQGPARRAIEIRLQINKASTRKLDKMAKQCGADGRARFQTRYHGTSTGRNSGSGFQPLNLVRSWEHVAPEQLVRDVMYRDPKWLDCLYGSAPEAIAKASRHWIRAAPGNKIMSLDYVSIEAVVLACVSGEQWKIDAFRDGVKIYEAMADKIYGYPQGTVTKATHPLERQDGKTGELAFGYQGALNAWLKFDDSGRHSDERIIGFCKSWRAEHPNVVAFWRGMESAAIECVSTRRETSFRDYGFALVDDWLAMVLPDGKYIWYWKPELRAKMPRWHEPEIDEDCAAVTCRCRPQPQLTYMTKKGDTWFRTNTYGGKLVENAVQATARQLIWPAALAAEAAGYPVVLTVYDEIVVEPPEGFGSLKELEQIVIDATPEFAKSWPIRVDGWEGDRYKK